jgi:hypothetical protein
MNKFSEKVIEKVILWLDYGKSSREKILGYLPDERDRQTTREGFSLMDRLKNDAEDIKPSESLKTKVFSDLKSSPTPPIQSPYFSRIWRTAGVFTVLVLMFVLFENGIFNTTIDAPVFDKAIQAPEKLRVEETMMIESIQTRPAQKDSSESQKTLPIPAPVSETDTPYPTAPGFFPQGGASTISEESRINVVSPIEGEILNTGGKYYISWDNFDIWVSYLDDGLNIALEETKSDGTITTEMIASGVSSSVSGEYEWRVPQGSVDSTYKIQIWPFGARNYIGKSGTFFIVDSI